MIKKDIYQEPQLREFKFAAVKGFLQESTQSPYNVVPGYIDDEPGA